MRLRSLLGLALLPAAAQAYVPELADLPSLPVQALAPAHVHAAVESVKGQALRYAAALPLSLSLAEGRWDAPEAGLARWRLRVHSLNAQNLSLHVQDIQLPAGGELWVYDEQGRDLHGPYAAQPELWTPVVRSETLILEARMPEAARAAFSLRVAQAFHGYRDPFGGPQAKGQIGDSGSCNIDVACADGDGWRDEIRSTVLLTISNSTLCSGTLLNNVLEDERPLVLSANHCGITTASAASVTAYFNTQRAACNEGTGPINQTVGGARLLASDSANRADFALIEMLSRPPADFRVYYAGWNARPPTEETPQSGVGIHHPGGDDKKISTYTSAAQRRDNVRIGGGPNGEFFVDAWQVQWARGVTEGGSSGSGLWNQKKQLVGLLSGGSSSCDNPGGSDLYARLDHAWVANTSSTGQLRAHLADGGSVLELAGRNGPVPAASSTPEPAPEPSQPPPTANASPKPAPAPSPGPESRDDGGMFGGALPLNLMLFLLAAIISRRAFRG